METPENDRLHGACHCGRVRVTLPADCAGVIACHCTDCLTAVPFSVDPGAWA